ncbi:hypothetical protein ACOME3_010495 [Neoechinorhynchus agilis]
MTHISHSVYTFSFYHTLLSYMAPKPFRSIHITHKSSERSSPDIRLMSPSSPRHISRVQEKEELQTLNDRLASYIERVNRLEADNAKLKAEISNYQERHSQDGSRVNTIYDAEIQELRKTLDEVSKDRARLAIEAGKHSSEAVNAANKLTKCEKQLKQLEVRLRKFEGENADLKAKQGRILLDVGRKTDEVVNLKSNLNDAERQLSKIRRELEDETMLRVDLGNQVNSLKEDAQFKAQIRKKQIDELSHQRRTEVKRVDERIKQEYDGKFIAELNKIRTETEAKISEMRDEVEQGYNRRLVEAQESSKRQAASMLNLKEDLQALRLKVNTLIAERHDLRGKCTEMEEKIRVLEDEIGDRQRKFDEQLGLRDAEISELKKKCNEMNAVYQDLLNMKVSLDREISEYAKLIESGEELLHLKSRARFQEIFITTSAKRKKIDQPFADKRTKSLNESTGVSGLVSTTIEIIDEGSDAGTFVKHSNK